MSEREYNNLKIAMASSAMEGFPVTAQTERDCIRLMNGDISIEEMVHEIISRHKN